MTEYQLELLILQFLDYCLLLGWMACLVLIWYLIFNLKLKEVRGFKTLIVVLVGLVYCKRQEQKVLLLLMNFKLILTQLGLSVLIFILLFQLIKIFPEELIFKLKLRAKWESFILERQKVLRIIVECLWSTQSVR